jgi:hypothetical protein
MNFCRSSWPGKVILRDLISEHSIKTYKKYSKWRIAFVHSFVYSSH